MHAFNPSEFVRLASQLAEDDREAWSRTAIYRAYFGNFLIARGVTGVTARDGTAHAQTRDRLRSHGRQMKRDLSLLNGMRKKADYMLDVKVSIQDASDAIKIAVDLHRNLLRLKRKLARQRSSQDMPASAGT